MSQAPELGRFLEEIMGINVLRLGGAQAGILGASGADSDIANSLKRSAIAFAGEYRKPAANREELERLSNEVAGFLQTLQLMNTLSEQKTDHLLDQLQTLMEG